MICQICDKRTTYARVKQIDTLNQAPEIEVCYNCLMSSDFWKKYERFFNAPSDASDQKAGRK